MVAPIVGSLQGCNSCWRPAWHCSSPMDTSGLEPGACGRCRLQRAEQLKNAGTLAWYAERAGV
jgi:hypothetical protein